MWTLSEAAEFTRLTRVPKCCEALPWDDKCAPCKRCVIAWSAYHSFCDANGYPVDWAGGEAARLDAYVAEEVETEMRNQALPGEEARRRNTGKGAEEGRTKVAAELQATWDEPHDGDVEDEVPF